MQVLKQHKRAVLVGLLLVAVLIVSLFVFENAPKPSSAPTPSPAPTASSTPTASQTPAGSGSSSPTVSPTAQPTAEPVSNLYPGEVTQFEGQKLTPIYDYLNDLSAHPDVSIGGVQNLNQTTYRLTVTGLVNHPVEYTYSEIISNFTSYQYVAPLICVEGWSATCLWQGALVSDLIKDAGVSPDANTLIFTASDGYTTSLPLAYAAENNLSLAYKINNVTLPAAAGWPLMLIPQDQYGYKWIRWVTEIDVSNDSSYRGYWESRGYPNNASVTNPDGASPAIGVLLNPASFLLYAGVIIIAIVAYRFLVKVKRKRSGKADWRGLERS